MASSPALRGISLILPRVRHGAGLLQRTVGVIHELPLQQDCGSLAPRSGPMALRGHPFLSNLGKWTFLSETDS